MCISSAIQDKIDPASWIMRKQGWAGAENPLANLDRAIERKSGFGIGPTRTERKAESMNRSAARQIELREQHVGLPAHAANIARAGAPPVQVGIAGRRPG